MELSSVCCWIKKKLYITKIYAYDLGDDILMAVHS